MPLARRMLTRVLHSHYLKLLFWFLAGVFVSYLLMRYVFRLPVAGYR